MFTRSELLKLLGLEKDAERPVGEFSLGMKKRLALAIALLHQPQILVLDEPTDGLDPNQKHEVRELLERMASTKAIIISTHILEEVDAVCSRAIIISQGRIVADKKPSELEMESVYHNAVGIRLLNENVDFGSFSNGKKDGFWSYDCKGIGGTGLCDPVWDTGSAEMQSHG